MQDDKTSELEQEGEPIDFEQLREQMLEQDDVLVTAEFFKALSDPTRICIVNALQIHEWLCVSDLAELLGLTKSALSHQLSYLRLNKLVTVKRDGKRAFYALNDDHVKKVFDLAISHIRE
ncbi:MAG: metalloregulator ArsR/SmtB family transcription factor [Succinivibrio sp.]|nr:metalloregulator ArsR/SmtB family transcription factor [Succinivibrio sp.]